MNQAHSVSPDVYFHVRIVLGMVLGLSLTRLLSGVAVYVQHPGRQPVSWLHLGWTLLMFLMVIHFWWFEFQLRGIERMTFPIYFFVLIYGSAWFILCALLYPSDIVEYDGYEDYFLSRRAWFFGIFAAMQGLDWSTRRSRAAPISPRSAGNIRSTTPCWPRLRSRQLRSATGASISASWRSRSSTRRRGYGVFTTT
jgi:hypothetical protein